MLRRCLDEISKHTINGTCAVAIPGLLSQKPDPSSSFGVDEEVGMNFAILLPRMHKVQLLLSAIIILGTFFPPEVG